MALAQTVEGIPDVSDPALYQNDTWQPVFARMRREAPIHYHAESPYGPYWSITKYQDIMAVSIDHETYSNERGGIQILDQPLGQETKSFIRMDPPRHTAHRKTVQPIFSPSVMGDMAGTIRQRTGEILDSLPRGEAFNWVDLVSVELTTMMLATLFDYPWEERHNLTYWSDVAVTDYAAPDALVRSREAQMVELGKMADAFATLWAERAKAPPKRDLISMMAHSESTRELTSSEFIGTLALLIVGGNDTTRNTMSGGLLALHENPDEMRRLRADPSLVTKLVPETIRYQTPVIHMRRTATKDAELNGHRIAEGDKVVMWYVSGNNDEAVIDNPDVFSLDRRKPRQHLAFGWGIHRCVGDRLGELQLQILWEEVLARGLEIEVVGAPRRVYSNFLRGIKELPVRIRP
ncbi:MAG: cytochrome P450 [Proteobacteria bacterium]|nr:cytochrome P450 [Pseudomonadota bacterium]MDA1308071.1 cytochrome P450 [Pseudomonadota bacterium]